VEGGGGGGELGGPSREATRQLGRAFPAAVESAREVRENILLSEDQALDRACLGRRLEAELLVEQRAKGAVTYKRVVLAAERVEREDAGALGTLAEAVERGGGVTVSEGGIEVTLGQCGVRCVEVCSENPSLVAAAQVDRPGAVRLVFEDLAADKCERLLEGASSRRCRLARRALEQLVEPVEVDHDEIGRESVRLRLGHDERPRPISIWVEIAAQARDERLQRTHGVLRPLGTPDQLGEPVGCDAMATRREQKL